MKSLSLRAGLTESAIRDAIGRGRSPSIDNFVKMAEALGVSPVWLLQGDERFRLKIPTIGVAGDGETWIAPSGRQASSALDIDIAGSDLICVRVVGNGLSPTYRNGDELLCQRKTGAHADNLIGLDCVIETKDGRRYIKVIGKGKGPNLYDLRSLNPVLKDVENVVIAWAAPIVMVKRAGV